LDGLGTFQNRERGSLLSFFLKPNTDVRPIPELAWFAPKGPCARSPAARGT
jgi:hypothetical protein